MATLAELITASAEAYDKIEAEDRVSLMQALYGSGPDQWRGGKELFAITGNETSLELMMAIRKLYPKNAEGILLTVDGWGYPKHILDKTIGMSNEEAHKFFKEQGQPSQHPERVTNAMILAVTKDEVVVGNQIRGEELAIQEDALETGGRIVDGLRIIVTTARANRMFPREE